MEEDISALHTKVYDSYMVKSVRNIKGNVEISTNKLQISLKKKKNKKKQKNKQTNKQKNS